MNCVPNSNFEVATSDHRIVTAKIQLGLGRYAARTTITVHYDCYRLINKDIRDRDTFTLRDKFDALQEIAETPTPNDEYENFVNSRLKPATEYIANKQRAKPRGDISG